MHVLAIALVPFLAAWIGPQDEDATLAVGLAGRRIAEWIQAAESVGFSGSVLAARDGEVVAAVGVGKSDLEGAVPNTPATLFEIASATKQFTGAAVMRLVEEDALSLDESIAEVLPGIPEDCRAITVRHLLQHTSGIPGTNSRGAGDDLKKVLPSFLRGGPKHEPGTHWEYWNQGYSLLSEIIARTAREDYVTFCKKSLFIPAGMNATCFTGDQVPRGLTVAVGRSFRGAPRSALEHPYGSYGFQYRGMGGAVTNVWDLWRWDRALHGDDVLGDAARKELFKPGLEEYALGWYVKKNRKGRIVQSHGGGVRGFTCDVRRYPKEDGCLFVLCNRDDVPVMHIAQGLEEILFKEKPTIRKPPKPLDKALQEALAGRYEDQHGNAITIEPDGIVTRARVLWSPPSGPVTRSALGLDDRGNAVMYEWQSVHEIKLDRRGKNPVKGFSLLDNQFKRRD